MQKKYSLFTRHVLEQKSMLIIMSILALSFIGTAKADIKPVDTPKHTYEFYVGGKLVDTQIVLNSEVVRPVVPEPTKSESQLLGWFDEDNVQVEFNTPIAVSEIKTIRLNSKFQDEVFVSYFVSDLHPDPSKEQYMMVAVNGYTKGQEVKLPMNIPIVDANGDAFSHWSESPDSPTEYIPGPITEHKSLYARYKKGYKISFITNGGGFVLPVYAYPPDGTGKGESLDMLLPSDKYPIRKGYAFMGWTYTKEDNNGSWEEHIFDTKMPIDKDYLLRAVWSPNDDTEYLCLYMFENANDDGYSLRHVAVSTGTTGEPTVVYAYPLAKDKDDEIEHFVFNEKKTFAASEETYINGDKTSVRKIYYDRRTYKMSFRVVGREYKEDHYTQKPIKEYEFKYGYLYDKEWNAIIHSKEWGGGVWYYLIDDRPVSIRPTYQTMRGEDDHVTRFINGPYVHVDEYIEIIETPEGNYVPVKNKPIPRKPAIYNVHIVLQIPDDKTPEDQMARQGPALEGFSYVNRQRAYGKVNDPADPYYGKYKNKLLYERNTYNISFVTNYEDVTIIKLPVLYQDNIDQKIKSWSEARQLEKGKSRRRVDGYFFDGWYTSPAFTKDAEIDINKTMPAHDLIVYAKWIPPVLTVRLHETTDFDSKVLDSVKVMKDHLVIASKNGSTNPDDINNFKYRKEYGDSEFLDWYRYVSGQFVKYDTSLPVVEDLDLYPVYAALWFNLEYDAGQAGNTKPEGDVPIDNVNYAAYIPGLVQYPSELEVPKGYYFDGWLSSDNYISFPGELIELPFMNLKLTAQWTKTPETNIVYNANGGVGDDVVVSGLNNNAEHTVMANEKFSREGFEFLHWSTRPDAGGDVYKAGAELIVSQPTSPTSNILYAQWAKTTSVRNISLNSKLRFYPNPVVDRLYIDTEKQIQSVEVLNLAGRRVLFVESLAADNALKVLDMSQLEAGAYIVRLVMKDGFDVLKVVKQ